MVLWPNIVGWGFPWKNGRNLPEMPPLFTARLSKGLPCDKDSTEGSKVPTPRIQVTSGRPTAVGRRGCLKSPQRGSSDCRWEGHESTRAPGECL